MNTELLPKRAEFVRYRPENLILVENTGDGVIIRATRDNFNERQKEMFIHEVSAEGFIPDHFQKFSFAKTEGWPEMKWIIDSSWAVTHWRTERLGSRFMVRFILGACVLWLVLLGCLLAGLL